MDIRKNISEIALKMDRKTLTTILGHVEKYCGEVEEVEELLWNLIDEIDNFEKRETLMEGRKGKFEIGQKVICKATGIEGEITAKEWEDELDGWLYDIWIAGGTCIYRVDNEITSK